MDQIVADVPDGLSHPTPRNYNKKCGYVISPFPFHSFSVLLGRATAHASSCRHSPQRGSGRRTDISHTENSGYTADIHTELIALELNETSLYAPERNSKLVTLCSLYAADLPE
jgi:hypothetical protein